MSPLRTIKQPVNKNMQFTALTNNKSWSEGRDSTKFLKTYFLFSSLCFTFKVLLLSTIRLRFTYVVQVFYYSTSLFTSSGLTEESAKFATMGIGAIMVGMTLVSLPLMDRTGRRTLHLYGLGGMFIFSIFITISFLIKVCLI